MITNRFARCVIHETDGVGARKSVDMRTKLAVKTAIFCNLSFFLRFRTGKLSFGWSTVVLKTICASPTKKVVLEGNFLLQRDCGRSKKVRAPR